MTKNLSETPAPAGENWLIRRLRRSVRFQYFLRRVVIDGTLPANPAAWLPVLFTGPRPPSGPGLRKAIRSWSRRRFRGVGCEMRVEEVDAPPPLLEPGGQGTRGGVAFSARCADGDRIACFLAWLAADGSRGTYAIFDEGADEITTRALEPFTDEGEIIGQLDRLAAGFVGEHVIGRAFEDWLDEYTPAWLLTEHRVSPEVAQRQQEEQWTYALVPHGNGQIIIGRSPLSCVGVEVGVFYADGRDMLVRQHYVGLAGSPAAMRALLTKNFGTGPDDTVIAAWMLHRVVPALQPAN
ncbi:MAG: hypothetical protein FGM15_09900 [Chthoniobacterales bacterium]|nr:hypothetical protein [Chthoniobacterales bacterium]